MGGREQEITVETLTVVKQLIANTGFPPPFSSAALGNSVVYEAGFPSANMGGNVAFAIDFIGALPFLFSRRMSFDQISFNNAVIGGASAVARVGLYNSDPNNLRPTSLIVDGGEFDTSAVGGVGIKAAAIAITLDPGLYWGVYTAGVSACSPSSYQLSGGAALCSFPFFGGTASIGTRVGWRVARAYGALPSSFPTLGITFLDANSAGGPSIRLRTV